GHAATGGRSRGPLPLRPLPAQHGGGRVQARSDRRRRLLVPPPQGAAGRRPPRGLRRRRLRPRPRQAGRAPVGAEGPPQLLTMTHAMLASPRFDSAGPRPGSGLTRILTPREFRLFQALIQREAGIHLSEAKKVLVEGRLARRLRDLGLDFADYYRLVESDPRERVHMLDCICTNETHFFREPRQFEFLESQVFPEWRARAEAGRMARRVRVWRAGCSTGEEPYSVAMAFLAAFPPASGWQIDIVATDLSTRVLDRAQAAVWPIDKAKEIPDPYLKAFMLRGTGPEDGRMKAGP